MQNVKHLLQENPQLTLSGSPVKAVQTTTSKTNLKMNQKTTSSHSKNAKQDAKRIETLFLRFSVIYGYLWQKAYPHEHMLNLAKKEWLETLHPFDNHIIKKALHHCRENCPYPPSLPQFIEICRAIKKQDDFFRCTGVVEDIASSEVAQKHLQEIRKKLSKQGEKPC